MERTLAGMDGRVRALESAVGPAREHPARPLGERVAAAERQLERCVTTAGLDRFEKLKALRERVEGLVAASHRSLDVGAQEEILAASADDVLRETRDLRRVAELEPYLNTQALRSAVAEEGRVLRAYRRLHVQSQRVARLERRAQQMALLHLAHVDALNRTCATALAQIEEAEGRVKNEERRRGIKA